MESVFHSQDFSELDNERLHIQNWHDGWHSFPLFSLMYGHPRKFHFKPVCSTSWFFEADLIWKPSRYLIRGRIKNINLLKSAKSKTSVMYPNSCHLRSSFLKRMMNFMRRDFQLSFPRNGNQATNSQFNSNLIANLVSHIC